MITLIIIIITVAISLWAFSKPQIIEHLIFNAYIIKNRKQWYRFFSSGLIHADLFHLFLNMYSLYLLGSLVENFFKNQYGLLVGSGLYLFLYSSALAVSSSVDYKKYENSPHYYALGASGAVSAIIFCCIILYPQQRIIIFPIPFPIPLYILGPLYLLYSYYMAQRNIDNIGHNAHLFGALYGLLFIFLVWKDALAHFIEQIR